MRADSWLCRAAVVSTLVVAVGGACSPPADAAPASSSSAPVTSCATVAQGSTGGAVKTIQKAVGTSVDGDFGPQTRKAVKHWQKSAGVPVTGVVDAATWAALPAKLAIKACGRQVTGAGVGVTCAQLAEGSSGLAVEVLQTALATTVDGAFGHATDAAVRAVQTDSKLKVTGITNIATWKAVHDWGTPACSTKKTVTPHESKDAKKQAKIRAHVDDLAATLLAKPGKTQNQIAEEAIAYAHKQLGKPYVYGGTGPKGYDCSGLQMRSYQHAGLTLPRVAASQYADGGVQEPLDHAKAGDLVFYASDVSKPATVYHVAMYVGGGNMLEAPHTGADVQVTPLRTTDLLPLVVRPVAGLTLPLKKGTAGWSVTQLQQSLDRHGAGLVVDGGFGKATAQAVKAWQDKHQLTASGVVHTSTWLTLR